MCNREGTVELKTFHPIAFQLQASSLPMRLLRGGRKAGRKRKRKLLNESNHIPSLQQQSNSDSSSIVYYGVQEDPSLGFRRRAG